VELKENQRRIEFAKIIHEHVLFKATSQPTAFDSFSLALCTEDRKKTI